MDDLKNISDLSAFDQDEELRIPPVIKVIGVGGGGGNAVNYLYKQGVENVTFMVCNTDKHALRNMDVPQKIVLGPNVTYGLGAGDNPVLGKEAAEESEEEIKRVLDDTTKMVFITAGMGGGTGTGAGPVVARIAKEAGMLTIGIVTIPFFFEGEVKIYKAMQGAEEMRKYVDSLLIINNERLTEIYPDLTFNNAFKKADDTLANATRSIAEIINTAGYINADFNDVKTTLENSSTAIISTGYGSGKRRLTDAIQDALNSPLLRNSDINSSKRLLFYLYFNPKAENVVTMAEMNEITQFSANLSPNIGVKWGACYDESLGEDVKITILASGFDLTIAEKGQTRANGGPIEFKGAGNKNESPRPSRDKKEANTPELDPESLKERIASEYGGDKMKVHNQEMARAKYVVLKPSQFDNEEVIRMFEKTPTHNRSLKLKEELRSTGIPGAEKESSRPAAERPAEKNAERAADDQTTPIVF